ASPQTICAMIGRLSDGEPRFLFRKNSSSEFGVKQIGFAVFSAPRPFYNDAMLESSGLILGPWSGAHESRRIADAPAHQPLGIVRRISAAGWRFWRRGQRLEVLETEDE